MTVELIDHSDMKLGKSAPKIDTRTLMLASYLPVAIPRPDVFDWFSGVIDWGMMRNNALGCCTISGVGHANQTWTGATGPMWTPTDNLIEGYYSLWDGYVPGNPSTDNGGVEIDVLNKWRKQTFGGMQLLAYADPSPQNLEHVLTSIYLFGGVYIGLALPVTAQRQAIWDVVPNAGGNGEPGSWGGHCVWVAGYDEPNRMLECITWGVRKKMTVNFWDSYCDESHTLLAGIWQDRAKNDFHFDSLMDDLNQITG